MSHKAKRHTFLYAFVFLLFLNALTDSLLRASRAPFVWATALLLFVYLSQGRLPPRRIMKIGIVGIALAVALFPYITSYRWLRAVGNVSIGEAMSRSLERSADMNAQENIQEGVSGLLGRVSAGPILVLVVGSHPDPLYRAAVPIIFEEGIAAYLTSSVFGRSDTDRISIGPSLVGWLWLVGGRYLVCGFAAVLGLISTYAWGDIRRRSLHLRNAACSLFLYVLLNLLLDGSVEIIPLKIGVSICLAIVAERFLPTFTGFAY